MILLLLKHNQSKLMKMEKKRTFLKSMVKALSDLLMKTNKDFQSKSKKDSSMKSINYFNDIEELPLFNWIKCTNGQMKYVRKDFKHGNQILDELHFEKIFDSYIKEFGLSETYIKLLKTMHKKTLLELDFVLTRNRFKLTEVEMQIVRLENMVNNNKNGMTIEQTLVHLSKWMNHWIDAKKVTTREYFDMMKEFEKSLKNSK